VHPQQQHLQPEVFPRPLALVVLPHRCLHHRPGVQVRQDHDPRPLQVRVDEKSASMETGNLELSGADCFVLDLLGDNIPHPVMDQVLGEIAKKTLLKNDLDHVDNHNQNLLKSTTAL